MEYKETTPLDRNRIFFKQNYWTFRIEYYIIVKRNRLFVLHTLFMRHTTAHLKV